MVTTRAIFQTPPGVGLLFLVTCFGEGPAEPNSLPSGDLDLLARLQRRRHLCSVLGFNEGVRRGLGGLAKHWAHDAGRAGSIELRL